MNMKKMANVILCLFLTIVFSGGVVGLRTALTPKGLFVKDNSHRGDGERRLSRDVQLKGYNLEQEPHKWVKAQFVVSNVSAEDVKNIMVVCEFYDPQAQYLDNEQWLLAGVVPADKTMENNSLKRKFIHTRATDFKCSITGYESSSASHSGNHGATEEHASKDQGNTNGEDDEHH